MKHFDLKEYWMIPRFNARLSQTIGIIMIVFFSIGCANTVTLKEEAGSEISISVTFQSAPNFLSTNYTFIFGSSSFNINTSLASNYFFIPGEAFEQTAVDTVSSGTGLNHFYQNYFQTWGGVLNLKETSISITSGPFTSSLSSTNPDADHFNYTPENITLSNYAVNSIAKTISFTIPLSELNISGNTMYFSIVTSQGINVNNTADLVSTIQFIELISNAPPQTGYNTSIFNPTDGAAKIISWTISVQ